MNRGSDLGRLAEAILDARAEPPADPDDTYHNMPVAPYLGIAAAAGFKSAYQINFITPMGSRHEFCEGGGIIVDKTDHCIDQFHIMFDRARGVLLVLDTFDGVVNSSRFYYNVRLNSSMTSSAALSGGYWSTVDPGVWVGNHDGRHGLAGKIRALEAVGKFIPVWAEAPSMLLTHHGERGNSLEGLRQLAELTHSRIQLLPEIVREAIRGRR